MLNVKDTIGHWRDNEATYAKMFEYVVPVAVTLLCLLAAVAYVIDPNSSESGPGSPYRLGYKLLLLCASALALVWGVHAFTGDPLARRSASVKFSYFFVFASFALISIPPLVKNQAVGTEPIGIVSGCVNDAGAAANVACVKDQKGPADVVRGGPFKNQWMINIGGVLTPQNASPLTSDGLDCKDLANASHDECKVGSTTNRAFISGGLVMPLPFVLISLFGGAISLSRRVPEIQKRSELNYLGTFAEPFMESGQVREMLMFQIMQFASAPLIAIVAYHVLQPEGIATSAGLAFLSGFGSEAVLLMIRGVSDGLKPSLQQSDKHGAVSGRVLRRGAPADGVAVCIAGGSPSTRTDDSGQYVLHSVPAGLQQVVFSIGDEHVAASVRVRGLRTEMCNMDLVSGYRPERSAPQVGGREAYVRVMLSVDVRGVDDGSARLMVDGRKVPIPADGLVELFLPSAGAEVELSGRSSRRALRCSRLVTPAQGNGETIRIALGRAHGYVNGNGHAAPGASR